MEKKYYNSLTSLRGIFIMIIVIYHIKDSFSGCFSDIFGFIYEYGGYFGNYYFFILSGFLLSNSYKERIAKKQINILEFMVRRLAKIYPLYILTNLYMLLFYSIQKGFLAVATVKDVLRVVFMVSWGWIDNVMPFNIPTWFISILVWCYIIYYFVAKLSDRYPDVYFTVIGLMILWGYFLMLKKWNIPFCFAQNGEALFNFFTGVGLYELLKEINRFYPGKWMGYIGGILMAAIVCGSCKYGFSAFTGDIRLTITLIICPFIIYCAVYGGVFEQFLLKPPLYHLGKISMSIFFLHTPLANTYILICGSLGKVRDIDMRIQFVVYLVLLLIISTISYELIECHGWKKIYQRHQKRKQ